MKRKGANKNLDILNNNSLINYKMGMPFAITRV